MHLEFLLEELSAEVTLRELVPKIVGTDVSFDIRVFQGKPDLLIKLPTRLKGYRQWIPEDWRIIIVVDRDMDDCRELKARLDRIVQNAGLHPKSNPGQDGEYHVINRLAIEELESWFFGDIDALAAAYSRVPPTLGKQARYRNPDGIAGGTSEALLRELQSAGYYKGTKHLPKIEIARTIAAHMEPGRNHSPSFRSLRDALRECVG
jgi:Domain of unknown function (DUF4276)